MNPQPNKPPMYMTYPHCPRTDTVSERPAGAFLQKKIGKDERRRIKVYGHGSYTPEEFEELLQRDPRLLGLG